MLSFFKDHREIWLAAFALTLFISLPISNVFLILALLSFIYYCYQHEVSLDKEAQPYFLVWGVFVAAMFASALCSGDIIAGLKYSADRWIWRVVPFVIALLGFKGIRERQNILYAILIGVGINNLFIIYKGITTGRRAGGFYGHYMMHAGFLCLLLPVLLVLLFEKKLLPLSKKYIAISFVISFGALIFNSTRGAWLSLIPVLLGISLCYMRHSKKVFIIALAFWIGVAGCLALHPKLSRRFASAVNVNKHTERILIWNSAWRMFKDHPVLGVGQGQFKHQYHQKYISRKAKEPNLTHAHNNIMQMLAENGSIGFVAFMSVFATILWQSLKKYLHNKNPWHLMILGSTTALFLQGLTEYNFGQSGVMKCYWLLLACLLVLGKYWEKQDR